MIIDKKIEYKTAEASIYDITGALLAKKSFNKNSDINLETYNLGSGVKIVVAKMGSYLFIDKIIVH